ncbi:unnamed protein product [Cladocopium goreaui]|uniref:Apoptosis-inducing factor 3 (Apoptosis-inducin g factor-like protein) n=1 Tax=Cladocopium goreaui TaxID=2562237 RepID=A0A9P1D1A8_9DINO|nr:unnamed protein product [Cladocopium goreaui]
MAQDLKNIFTLRTPEDAAKISALAQKGQKMIDARHEHRWMETGVHPWEILPTGDGWARLTTARVDHPECVVGGSFIGMEVASSLAKKGCDVAVIAMETVPFERVLGKKVGASFARKLQKEGVEWFGTSSVRLFRGNDAVNGVELEDGEVLPADAVVVGAGVLPNTRFVEGLSLDKNGAIIVNPLLQAENCENLFAAGDVCAYPAVKTGQRVRIEHWDVAMQQGRVAANNMLGKFQPFTTTPFFWSGLFGNLNLRFVGHAPEALDRVIIEGDVSNMEFISYYTEDDEIRAVATVNRDPIAVVCAELMRRGRMPSVSELMLGTVNAEVLTQSSKLTLKLLGDKKATQRAKLLLEVHIKHQSQIQNFQDVREKRLKALENKRNRIEGSGFKHSCEFTVDGNFIPRIIGKGGETIRAVREKYDVNIRILEPEESGATGATGATASGSRVVRIFGNNAQNVASARAEVEYVEEAMSLEGDQYNWLAGSKGMRSVWAFKEAAGLVYARLDYDSQQLLLCGTRSSVEDAIALFETHFMYCPVFRQMDEEMENIFAELESYGDYDARWESWQEEPKTKGSWGKDRNDRNDRNDRDKEKDSRGYSGSQNGSGRWADRESKDTQNERGGRWEKRKAERGDDREPQEPIEDSTTAPERSHSSREGKGGKKQREVVLAEPKGAKGEAEQGKATGRRRPPVGSGEDGDSVNGRAVRRGKMGLRS